MTEELVAVIDLGSSSTKGGFSAHDIPESVFPSVMSAWPKGTEVSAPVIVINVY